MRWTFAVETTVPQADQRPTPFTRRAYGSMERLAWPRGACQFSRRAHATYWGRFALVLDQHVWTLVDAERDSVVRIRWPPMRTFSELGVEGDVAWARAPDGTLRIPLDDLERLAPGTHDVELAVEFPERRAELRVVAHVESVERGVAIVAPSGISVRHLLDAERFALKAGDEVVLGDLLAPNRFEYVEVVGQPRRSLPSLFPEEHLAITCTREPARDPAAGARATLAPLDAEHAALLAQIADDDDVARGVLIDLLADRGDVEAATFALMRAGKRVPAAQRRAALGPLAHFFEVELDRGLPAIATLIRQPPADEASLEPLLGDLRLGLLVELRRANGPLPLYLRLLSSGALLSLRRADAPSYEALAILRDRRAGQLTHLARVPLASQIATAMLADAAFGSVSHVALEPPRPHQSRLVAAMAAALPPLPGRHVGFSSRGFTLASELARHLFGRFDELAVASLQVEGVTLVRDGSRVTLRLERDAPDHIVELAKANVTP